MGLFHLRTARYPDAGIEETVLLKEPVILESEHNDDELPVSGRMRSLRDPEEKVYPRWSMHGPVLLKRPQVRRLRLEWQDEGTVGIIDHSAPDSVGRFSGTFSLIRVSQERVMAYQERWQLFNGREGRNDPEDPLVHMAWRDYASGSVQGQMREDGIYLDIRGSYLLK